MGGASFDQTCGFSRSPASQLFTHTSAKAAYKWAVVHLPEKYVSPSPWTSTAIAGPVMVAALVVGLLISVPQVATQLQEMTLGYIPRLLAAALAPRRWGPG